MKFSALIRGQSKVYSHANTFFLQKHLSPYSSEEHLMSNGEINLILIIIEKDNTSDVILTGDGPVNVV